MLLLSPLLQRSVRICTQPCVRHMSNFVVLGNNESFGDIIGTDGSKILYFTASWCPPCRKIGPVFEKLSKEYKNTTFVKIDVDEFGEIAAEHNITSVPTFKALAGPLVISEFTGADENALVSTLKALPN
mmetsp:Transcript_4279/g.6894  ORF Transcript_4279/g.6894 Transcript_4279/m.6894 type:complete len:129 (-) Transcript_4279:4676-5062(-)